jgi:hypothetical protein
MKSHVRILDKALTVFINIWVGFVLLCMVVDIATIVYTAPSIWSGIWAAQEKWFDPFNVVHFIAEVIFVSPAIGAFFWRERLRKRVAASVELAKRARW